MTTIKIYDGNNYVEIEVEDDFALEYRAMEHKDALVERKETRRHQSLNKSMDNGFDIADTRVDIEESAIEAERLEQIFSCLTDCQREIARMFFLDGYSQKEISEQLGIAKSSMSERITTIKNKLKKVLSQPEL